jgi:hypothetical protein
MRIRLENANANVNRRGGTNKVNNDKIKVVYRANYRRKAAYPPVCIDFE